MSHLHSSLNSRHAPGLLLDLHSVCSCVQCLLQAGKESIYFRPAQEFFGVWDLDMMRLKSARVAWACGLERGAFHHRLVEDADFRAAQELFGGQDLDKMQPKTAKDFEDFAATLAHKYLLGHAKSAHYKILVKALFKVSSGTIDILS